MKLIFNTKNGKYSGILEIVRLLKTDDFEMTAICVDGTIVKFLDGNDAYYENGFDYERDLEQFDEKCEVAYVELYNNGAARIVTDYCSLYDDNENDNTVENGD